jgi:hypothetical protein
MVYAINSWIATEITGPSSQHLVEFRYTEYYEICGQFHGISEYLNAGRFFGGYGNPWFLVAFSTESAAASR